MGDIVCLLDPFGLPIITQTTHHLPLAMATNLVKNFLGKDFLPLTSRRAVVGMYTGVLEVLGEISILVFCDKYGNPFTLQTTLKLCKQYLRLALKDLKLDSVKKKLLQISTDLEECLSQAEFQTSSSNKLVDKALQSVKNKPINHPWISEDPQTSALARSQLNILLTQACSALALSSVDTSQISIPQPELLVASASNIREPPHTAFQHMNVLPESGIQPANEAPASTLQTIRLATMVIYI